MRKRCSNRHGTLHASVARGDDGGYILLQTCSELLNLLYKLHNLSCYRRDYFEIPWSNVRIPVDPALTKQTNFLFQVLSEALV